MEAPQQDSNNGKKGKSKQKKIDLHVDFTPMVDMNMLLITFFMLCTTLLTPQAMEIAMPVDDEQMTDEQRSKIKQSLAVTLLLDKDNIIYYYEGIPDWEDPNALKRTTYDPSGLRAVLRQKNAAVVNQVRELREQRKNLALVPGGDDEANKKAYNDKVSELKSGQDTPTVLIKATDDASYRNLVDVLDEMTLCNIGKYVIVPIAPTDRQLIQAATVGL